VASGVAIVAGPEQRSGKSGFEPPTQRNHFRAGRVCRFEDYRLGSAAAQDKWVSGGEFFIMSWFTQNSPLTSFPFGFGKFWTQTSARPDSFAEEKVPELIFP